MSRSFYWFSFVFFALLFGVFYGVACKVVLGVYENYRRYFPREDAYWNPPKTRFLRKVSQWAALTVAALLSAWLVVHVLVRPG